MFFSTVQTFQTYGQNFTAFWNLYKASGGNKGLIRRDYELLERILPDRVSSVEEWMRKTGYSGQRVELLKGWLPATKEDPKSE